MGMPKRLRRKGKKGKFAPWRPTRRMQLLLDTAEDWATRCKPLVLKDLADACGVEKTRPSKWMQFPEFREALALVIRRAQPALVESAITSVLQQAVKGNLLAFDRAMDRLERWGRVKTVFVAGDGSPTPGDSPQAVNGVIVNLYGIPTTTPDRSTLPPPIMRHPVTGEIVPIPLMVPLPVDGGAQTATSGGSKPQEGE